MAKKRKTGYFVEAGRLLQELKVGPHHERELPFTSPLDRKKMQNAVHVQGKSLRDSGFQIKTGAVGTNLRVEVIPPNGGLRVTMARETTRVAETPEEQNARLKLTMELADKLTFDKQKVLIKSLLRT